MSVQCYNQPVLQKAIEKNGKIFYNEEKNAAWKEARTGRAGKGEAAGQYEYGAKRERNRNLRACGKTEGFVKRRKNA